MSFLKFFSHKVICAKEMIGKFLSLSRKLLEESFYLIFSLVIDPIWVLASFVCRSFLVKIAINIANIVHLVRFIAIELKNGSRSSENDDDLEYAEPFSNLNENNNNNSFPLNTDISKRKKFKPSLRRHALKKHFNANELGADLNNLIFSKRKLIKDNFRPKAKASRLYLKQNTSNSTFIIESVKNNENHKYYALTKSAKIKH